MSSRTAAYMAQRTAETWREQVAGALAAAGLPARPHQRSRKLGEQVVDTSGDVVGIDGILITTRASRTLRLSEALDAADSLAVCHALDYDDEIAPVPIVIQRRMGRTTGESYALMTLDSLGALLARLRSAQ